MNPEINDSLKQILIKKTKTPVLIVSEIDNYLKHSVRFLIGPEQYTRFELTFYWIWCAPGGPCDKWRSGTPNVWEESKRESGGEWDYILVVTFEITILQNSKKRTRPYVYNNMTGPRLP